MGREGGGTRLHDCIYTEHGELQKTSIRYGPYGCKKGIQEVGEGGGGGGGQLEMKGKIWGKGLRWKRRCGVFYLK